MQSLVAIKSVWRMLRDNEIDSCQDALDLLVDKHGTLRVDLLDAELNYRFFREFSANSNLPPVIPLLLWRSCFYLGCPHELPEEWIKKIGDRTLTDVKAINISQESYKNWHRRQNIPDPTKIDSTPIVNPLTGETEQADICEITELYLSQAVNQTRRINALISVALQNRASDIHLEPTPKGLRVRYRIDGILRDIKVMSLDISRKIIVALKVMCDMDIAESRRPQDGRIGREYTSEEINTSLDMRVSTLPCVVVKKP
jgi:general secretion pathway protein E